MAGESLEAVNDGSENVYFLKLATSLLSSGSRHEGRLQQIGKNGGLLTVRSLKIITTAKLVRL